MESSTDDYYAVTAAALKWEPCPLPHDSGRKHASYNGFRIHKGPHTTPCVSCERALPDAVLEAHLGTKYHHVPADERRFCYGAGYSVEKLLKAVDRLCSEQGLGFC